MKLQVLLLFAFAALCCPVLLVSSLCIGPDGTRYQINQTFPLDHCNNCTCLGGVLMSCTEMRCEDIFMCPVPSPGNCTNACTGYNNCSGGQICCPGVNGCLIGGCVTPRQPANGTCFGPNGTRYQVNQTFPLGDRCNYCTCLPSGRVSCTNMICRTVFGVCPIPSPSQGNCTNPCNTDSDCGGRMCCPGVNGCPRGGCVTPRQFSDGTCFGHTGIRYQVNDTFPAGDQCNNCTCVAPGVITCTRERCTNNDDIPCSIRHVPGDCRNNTNRYFFDPSTSACLNFSGGCAGENLVEFSTPLACFQHCMIESICSAPVYPPGYDPSRCNITLRRWTFNNVSRRCEEFGFSLCGQPTGFTVFNDSQSCTRLCVNHAVPDLPTLPDRPTLPQSRCPPPRQVVRQCPSLNQCSPREREADPRACPQTCNPLELNPCQNGQQCCFDGCSSICTNLESSSFNVSCQNGGRMYQSGETFRNECNTCVCLPSGRIMCTELSCACSVRPVFGTCRSAVSRYYFDQSTGLCLNFSGGCGAQNMNEYATPRECYEDCNRNSICNAPIYPPRFVPRCNVNVRRWTFNSTSGICHEISFSLCGQPFRDFNVFSDALSCKVACVNRRTSECPNGLQRVNCFVDPCTRAQCPNYPYAVCKSNFCGGCSPNFFDRNGNNVTAQCVTRNTCADGSSVAHCLMDPCRTAFCPQYPNAICQSDFCGGCNHRFIDPFSRSDVTRRCSRVVPTPILQSVCPYITESIPCNRSCSSNNDCGRDGEICCSYGCGTACMAPVLLPYYKVPSICPDRGLSDFFRECPQGVQSCINSSQCETGEVCCQSRCGRSCQRASSSDVPCFAIRELLEPSFPSYRIAPTELFIPSCRPHGMFDSLQCNTTGVCWCVNILTGQPVSPAYPRSITPLCAGCTYNGRKYRVGDRFPSMDRCNHCECTSNGTVLCTNQTCADPCSLPPDPGPCRASLPAYYFNSTNSSCLAFTYGGCGGNPNKFRTIRDCLRLCNRQDPCLQPLRIGDCNSNVPSYFFNTTSGKCEKFNYSGCGGNTNRFSTGKQCHRQCSPNTNPDICLDIRCPPISCPPNSELIEDNRHCCPFCTPRVQCGRNQYRCANGLCISNALVCDRIADCPDGADENRCDHNECEFRCGDRTCIPRSQVCDRIVDCLDGADIRNCTVNFTRAHYLTPESIPSTCPSISDSLGTCVNECTSNSNCTNGTICCSNGCGRSCVPGILTRSICQSIVYQSDQNHSDIYRPQCEEDGTFSEVQCDNSTDNTTGYCWCVDVTTGQPVTEGVRGRRPQCNSCRRTGGLITRVGESYSTSDGCNTCICTYQGLICTRRLCDTEPCRVMGRRIPSNSSFSDECSTCRCFAGSLSCSRRNCSTLARIAALRERRNMTRTRLRYAGSYSMIMDRLDEFKRGVIRLLLNKYSNSMGLQQDQIQSVEVSEGSLVVDVLLADSNTTTGANVSLLVGQVQQDYEKGLLIVRHNNQVLEPTGQFQIEAFVDPSSTATTGSASGMLLSWHIGIIIAVPTVVLIVSSIIVIAVVLAKKGSQSSKRHPPPRDIPADKPSNNYEMVGETDRLY